MSMNPETFFFVEALRAVLQAEEKCMTAYSLYFGGGEESKPVIDLLSSLGITPSFEKVEEILKSQIGDTIQEGIWGHLPSQRTEGRV